MATLSPSLKCPRPFWLQFYAVLLTSAWRRTAVAGLHLKRSTMSIAEMMSSKLQGVDQQGSMWATDGAPSSLQLADMTHKRIHTRIAGRMQAEANMAHVGLFSQPVSSLGVVQYGSCAQERGMRSVGKT